MIIKTLVENTSITDEYGSEHGLSLYVETKEHKLLFDLGQGDLFLCNAQKLNIDLSEVDAVIISHGHYDHGGGLRTFLKINSKAKIYLNQKAFEKHYSIRSEGIAVYVGLEQELKDEDRLVFVAQDLEIDDELTLFSKMEGNELLPVANNTLLVERGFDKVPDDFCHEQNLIITENRKTVLFSGCAHRGIVNIINQAIHIKNKRMDFVIGGFHLKNHGINTHESSVLIEQIAERIKETGALCYTGHCTGLEAYEQLKKSMGNKILYLAAGSAVNL